jgi:hypothetical protein
MTEAEGDGPGFGAARDVARTVSRLVVDRTPAVVVVPGERGTAVGTFGESDGRLVSIDVCGRGPGVLSPSPCAVSFHVDGRAAVFLSQIEAWRFGGHGLPRILVRLPDVIVVESRRFPRLSVPPDLGLQVRVSVDEVAWPAQALDISFGGVATRLVGGDARGLQPGTLARLNFAWPYGEPFGVSALLVRRTENLCGFAFASDAINGADAEKLRTLIRRVAALSGSR